MHGECPIVLVHVASYCMMYDIHRVWLHDLRVYIRCIIYLSAVLVWCLRGPGKCMGLRMPIRSYSFYRSLREYVGDCIDVLCWEDVSRRLFQFVCVGPQPQTCVCGYTHLCVCVSVYTDLCVFGCNGRCVRIGVRAHCMWVSVAVNVLVEV